MPAWPQRIECSSTTTLCPTWTRLSILVRARRPSLRAWRGRSRVLAPISTSSSIRDDPDLRNLPVPLDRPRRSRSRPSRRRRRPAGRSARRSAAAREDGGVGMEVTVFAEDRLAADECSRRKDRRGHRRRRARFHGGRAGRDRKRRARAARPGARVLLETSRPRPGGRKEGLQPDRQWRGPATRPGRPASQPHQPRRRRAAHRPGFPGLARPAADRPPRTDPLPIARSSGWTLSEARIGAPRTRPPTAAGDFGQREPIAGFFSPGGDASANLRFRPFTGQGYYTCEALCDRCQGRGAALRGFLGAGSALRAARRAVSGPARVGTFDAAIRGPASPAARPRSC